MSTWVVMLPRKSKSRSGLAKTSIGRVYSFKALFVLCIQREGFTGRAQLGFEDSSAE